eukprot:CAMPEP_0182550418 /NCGR_PEP_ID=MMETSP1323-20130603/41564_1 /TAXON_ID=236787 /ORGANISM="Florenciella parvula, Strain RCC1693" /LENGTH=59 /DNA_ID=CAMNT_0024761943 /DNA_START=125 /DNA_END=301 /DNA_ORIENTATION=+
MAAPSADMTHGRQIIQTSDQRDQATKQPSKQQADRQREHTATAQPTANSQQPPSRPSLP